MSTGRLGVSVWAPVSVGRPATSLLGPGERLRFGRDTDGSIGLVIDDPAVSRLAGEITAVEDHWTITNFSRRSTYVIRNPEGGGEFVKVAPRRLAVPVPFEFSDVILHGAGRVAFKVTAPFSSFLAPGQEVAGPDPTLSGYSIDQTARYFLILVALCERRLRDPADHSVPSAAQLVDRLAHVSPGLTVDAVNSQIKYLADTKMVSRDRGAGGRGHRTQALVAMATSFDLVREEHLALLRPARPPGGRPPPD